MLNVQTIMSNIKYAGTTPVNAEEIVAAMLAAKNLGDRTFDKLEAEFGVTAGFFAHVKAIIKEEKSAIGYQPNAQAAREDRILRTRTSDGRAVARKW